MYIYGVTSLKIKHSPRILGSFWYVVGMLKHGDKFAVILANGHSPAAAKVQLCVDIILSILRHNQTSMTVFHAALETAVPISHIPVFNCCKEIFELTISKTEKAVEATRKD